MYIVVYFVLYDIIPCDTCTIYERVHMRKSTRNPFWLLSTIFIHYWHNLQKRARVFFMNLSLIFLFSIYYSVLAMQFMYERKYIITKISSF